MAIPWTLYVGWLALGAVAVLGVLHAVAGQKRPITIGLLAVVAVVFCSMGWRQHQDVRTASRVAHLVTRHADRSVRCLGWFSLDRLTHSQAEGWVTWSGDGSMPKVAQVDATQCRRFRAFATGHGHAVDLDSAIAVEVVIHESVHLAGTLDEAATTCKALVLTPRVLAAFGKSDDVGRQVVRRYLHEVYACMPEEYQVPDRCAGDLERAGLAVG